jgi:hypothetical protein
MDKIIMNLITASLVITNIAMAIAIFPSPLFALNTFAAGWGMCQLMHDL